MQVFDSFHFEKPRHTNFLSFRIRNIFLFVSSMLGWYFTIHIKYQKNVLNGSTIECNAWVRLIYFCSFYGVTPNYIEKLEKCFNCDAFLLRSSYIIDNAARYFSDDTAIKWLMKNGMLQIFAWILKTRTLQWFHSRSHWGRSNSGIHNKFSHI